MMNINKRNRMNEDFVCSAWWILAQEKCKILWHLIFQILNSSVSNEWPLLLYTRSLLGIEAVSGFTRKINLPTYLISMIRYPDRKRAANYLINYNPNWKEMDLITQQDSCIYPNREIYSIYAALSIAKMVLRKKRV